MQISVKHVQRILLWQLQNESLGVGGDGGDRRLRRVPGAREGAAQRLVRVVLRPAPGGRRPRAVRRQRRERRR